MSTKVYEWIANNSALISDIYTPLSKSEYELISRYDDVFKDSIRENTKALLYSMVCIEFNRCTGESIEEFYSVIDEDELYKFIVRIEDYYDELEN
jgi:hypothetical protein